MQCELQDLEREERDVVVLCSDAAAELHETLKTVSTVKWNVAPALARTRPARVLITKRMKISQEECSLRGLTHREKSRSRPCWIALIVVLSQQSAW